MLSKLASVSAVLLVAQPALADFKVYCGAGANAIDGGGIAASCIFFNNPPSCDDVGNSVNFYNDPHGDVSKGGGLVCDGCDISAAPSDWTITRIEINDSGDALSDVQYFDGAGDHPHFTIYNGDTGVGIQDTDGNSLGTCTVPAEPQNVNCGGVASTGDFKEIFDCTSQLTYNSSPN